MNKQLKRIFCLLMAVMMVFASALADVSTSTGTEEQETATTASVNVTTPTDLEDNEPEAQEDTPVAKDDTCEVHTVLCNDLFTCTVCGATLSEDDDKTIEHDEWDTHRYDDTYHYVGCSCGQ